MNVIGRLINVLGKSIVITQEPKYPVVQFISDSDYQRKTQTMESNFVVREMLTTLGGGKTIVNYIRKAR
jgi:hypothetical protein